jgi:RNA polymerase-binding transcription factor DksA
VSNKVLEHALAVNIDIANLREAVANTSVLHRRDVRKQQQADAALEFAYADHADVTTAIEERARITAESDRSLQTSLAATKALKDYRVCEDTRARKARQGK